MGWIPGQRIIGEEPDAGPARTDAPVVGVLALQGDVLEHIRVLHRVGAVARPVRRPEDLGDLDGIVIPGGESTTIGKLLVRLGLLEPLRDRLRAGLPALGTCAGLILLSRALDQDAPQPLLGGLDVVSRRNAFGTQVDSFDCELSVPVLAGGPLPASFIRAPAVVETGPGVEVLATYDGSPVLVRDGSVVGAAFHPELSDDDRLHRWFLELVATTSGRAVSPSPVA